MLLHEATNGYDGIDTVTISIGSGITIDDDIIDGMDLLKYMEKFLMKKLFCKVRQYLFFHNECSDIWRLY